MGVALSVTVVYLSLSLFFIHSIWQKKCIWEIVIQRNLFPRLHTYYMHIYRNLYNAQPMQRQDKKPV